MAENPSGPGVLEGLRKEMIEAISSAVHGALRICNCSSESWGSARVSNQVWGGGREWGARARG